MGSSPVDEDTSSVAIDPVPSYPRLQPLVEDGDPFVMHSGPNNASAGLETVHAPRRTTSGLPRGKEKEQSSVVDRQRPLRLLDLPLDILREIINQLPHTNDLTSLALCHSVLHSLAIPCIYSRFDIVWPDTNAQSEPRTGVDALTYGLSTLVMAEEIFGEAQWQRALAKSNPKNADRPPLWRRRRRGNHYAQYTKKFSLGNGPFEYVQEYLVTKEGGKMLGTLVALAVARMRNLETFIWDMPTGVLREVWLALSSLDDRDDQQDCRLEKVWIRWHDNDAQHDMIPPPPALPQLGNLHVQNLNAHGSGLPPPPPAVMLQTGQFISMPPNLEPVEHPTFSVLPALKSLTVLDIDELPYLDEMSVLIARSQIKLRELRIGIAAQAENQEWAQVWEGDSLQQVDYDSSSTLTSKIGNSRLGGVLGVLLGRVYNMRNNVRSVITSTNSSPIRRSDDLPTLRPSMTSIDGTVQISYLNESQPRPDASQSSSSASASSSADSFAVIQGQPSLGHASHQVSEDDVSAAGLATPKLTAADLPPLPSTPKSIPLRTLRPPPRESRVRGPYLDGQLKVEILELERVPLSITIMQRAFDWSILTSLTLINCPNHEQLWKSLRHLYSPPKPPKVQSFAGVALGTPPYTPSPGRQSTASPSAADYSLSLKRIHTNTASTSLLNFIKDTLAPNSLEVFFLQDSRVPASSTVSVEAIHRAVIRRHRSSLKKLMVDSSDPRGSTDYSNARWRRWMMNREILTFITSGKMPHLRELGFTIDYKDWHFFLQNLPAVSHVRSLYIPHIADHPHSATSDPRELALQIVDIVTLRVDIELCYLGIGNKCFEILENKNSLDPRLMQDQGSGLHGAGTSAPNGYTVVPGGPSEPLIMDEDGEADDGDNNPDEDVGGEDENDTDDAILGNGDGDDVQSESEEEFDDDSSDSEADDFAGDDGAFQLGKGAPKLRLREILFYDDKVAVFRARHGKL